MIGFEISENAPCASIAWVACLVFVTDAESEYSKLSIRCRPDEIFDASDNRFSELINETVLMKFLCIRLAGDKARLDENDNAGSRVKIDEGRSAIGNCSFHSARLKAERNNSIMEYLSQLS